MMKGSDRMNGLLSVIIPAYNEQEMIPKAAATIAEILEQAEISYELLFVNDGSRDLSWQCIEEAANQKKDWTKALSESEYSITRESTNETISAADVLKMLKESGAAFMVKEQGCPSYSSSFTGIARPFTRPFPP